MQLVYLGLCGFHCPVSFIHVFCDMLQFYYQKNQNSENEPLFNFRQVWGHRELAASLGLINCARACAMKPVFIYSSVVSVEKSSIAVLTTLVVERI